MSQLKGKEWQQLTKALLDAFPTPNDLRNMLRFQRDLNLAVISASGTYEDIVFDVIQYHEARDQTIDLIADARKARPTNVRLMVMASKTKATVETPGRQELEAILSSENKQFDVAEFLRRVGELEGRICRVEVGTVPCGGFNNVTCGTGFLVGPDVVLTNYHVIEQVKKGMHNMRQLSHTDVICRFDYKLQRDGLTLNPGTEYRLAQDWLLADSPYSPHDRVTEAMKQAFPESNELDFALLRLNRPAGNEKLGSEDDRKAPVRGFIQLPQPNMLDPDFGANRVMYIMQHPAGKPLKLTVNTFRNYNPNKTRVTYLNDTEGGSSGSPVFDANWRLVALHHSGDPTWAPEYNEGIPINRVVDYLSQNNLMGKLQPASSGTSSAGGSDDDDLDF